MKEIKINDLIIKLGNNGDVILREKENMIYLGCVGGIRFDTLEQVLKTAKELKYLADLGDDLKWNSV